MTNIALGDGICIHHGLSDEPFTKDKFEYALKAAATFADRSAFKAPKGNPGYDVTIDGEKFSLKTLANKRIKTYEIHISKFMELGKREWDFEKLREQFFAHMQSYDRILVLRALSQAPKDWTYELVEIPKSLLEEARFGELGVDEKSKQNPKPDYYRVFDDSPAQQATFRTATQAARRPVKFALYFDAGGERKLQIRYIRKDLCRVHATWRFPAVSLAGEV